MSRKELKKAVIRYLKHSDYKFLRDLGEGGFADVIAVRTPDKQDEAIKIIPKRKISPIEDQYWPKFRHPNLLPVNKIMEIEELDVKLYFMPIVPKALDDMVHSKEFRKDPNSFNRVKKWLIQILSAIEHLHDGGFCHMDIKTDNVLIDSEDNALLADFSGLNFTKTPLNRYRCTYTYRPPESFTLEGIRGELYDMWSFSVLALNVFTDHYYLKKKNQITGKDAGWWSQLWPILMKALMESKFQKLMKKAFPKAHLSANDINLAHHFVEFIMKIRPESRPSAFRAKNHLLLKTISNPFMNDCYDAMKKMSDGFNPFNKDQDDIDHKGQGDVKSSIMGAVNSLIEHSQHKDIPKRRNDGKNVKKLVVGKDKQDLQMINMSIPECKMY